MAEARGSFSVVIDPDAALLDLAKITDKGERNAILNAVDKLRQLGPQLVQPHAKSLKGESDLFELRPRGGKSACRPICKRSDGDYIILAISKDHEADMGSFVAKAATRAARYP